ncbi:MAG: hypothetical protein WA821_08405, partial [Anaerolineales bacterium]
SRSSFVAPWALVSRPAPIAITTLQTHYKSPNPIAIPQKSAYHLNIGQKSHPLQPRNPKTGRKARRSKE